MIQELKINFYRLIRSRFFVVISLILLFFSLLTAVEVKLCVDDPYGLFSDYIESAYEDFEDLNQANEDEDSILELEVGSSISRVIEMFKMSNSFDGVLRMQYYENGVFFLFAMLTALFVGSEFKSRFHINRFSLNASAVSIACGEISSLILACFILEVVSYLISLGFTVLFCHSFNKSSIHILLENFILVFIFSMFYIVFSYMVAFVRRASALSVVLSCLFASGMFDLFFVFLSHWVNPLKYFAISSTMNSILTAQRLSAMDYFCTIGAVVILIVSSFAVTIAVAAKRDPY